MVKNTSEYMKDRVFELQRKIWRYMIDHHSYTHNLSSGEIKAWKKSAQAWFF